ncbi:hypothetical protein LP7551_04161 [Roseibium album]|nr:hypothetical protein LP7551_04161 [Roseibium album]
MWFYISPRGRASRSDYWIRLVLPFTAVLLVIGALGAKLPEWEPAL